MALLHTIREAQSALAALVSSELSPTPRSESLERFLARLPHRWQQEQEQADGKPRVKPPRTWRTRKDPFGGKIPSKLCVATYWTGCSKIQTPVLRHCWADWKKLNRIVSAGLTSVRCSVRCKRTLQWRVQQWRGIMASKLVYAASEVTLADHDGMPEMALAAGPTSAEFSVTFLDEATGTGKYG